MNKLNLPKDLQAVLENEDVDFVVYEKRQQPKSLSYRTIVFSILWLFIPSFVGYVIFNPLFKGEDVHLNVNGVPTIVNSYNLALMVIPSLILILFSAFGIGFLFYGIIMLTKKGGYYVGTKNRIINYLNGNITYFDWDQFSGNVELNFNKKNISLEMRRGKIKRGRDNDPDEFIPEILHLSGI